MWDLFKVSELVGIISIINGLSIWAMKRLLDGQRDAFTERLRSLTSVNDGHEDELKAVREELSQFKVESTRAFIHREDAVIYFGRFEQKIDAIWSYLIHVKQDGE